MMRLAVMAALCAATAVAGQLTVVTEPALPRDPSGFPVFTNSLPDQVAMLTVRMCRLEAYVASNEARRVEMAERRARASEAAAKSRAEASAAARWLQEAQAKYGRMVLVGYDTNTCERVYRRADGVEMRRRWPLDTPVVRPPRPRKGGRK